MQTGRMASVLAGHGNHLSTPLKYVETPCPRSKLSHLSFSGQLSPPLGPSLLPNHILASSQLPPRPYKGPNSILSHSQTIPLSLLYFGPPSHLPLAWLLTFYPISQSHYTSLFLLLRTTHPPGIGPVPHLSSPIPYRSAQSTELLYNQLSFRARFTHGLDDGGSTRH
jgi:hypothetical protein